jgi:hypothetical protein
LSTTTERRRFVKNYFTRNNGISWIENIEIENIEMQIEAMMMGERVEESGGGSRSKGPSSWGQGEVKKFLRSKGHGEVMEAVVDEHKLDGKALLLLNEHDIRDVIGITVSSTSF